MSRTNRTMRVFGIAMTAMLAAMLSAARGGMIDDRVYGDEFEGSSLGSEWTTQVDGTSSLTVGSGLLTLSSLVLPPAPSAYASVWHITDALAGLAVSVDWWAEVRFKVTAPLTTTATRDYGLLIAQISSANTRSCGVDFRLMADGSPGGATFSLGWYGYDPDDYNRVATTIATGLGKDVFHTVSAHRKSDGSVDVYLEGSLITNAPVLNPGTNPSLFRMGESAGDSAGTVAFDYVKAGGLPIADAGIDDSIFFDDFDGNQVVTVADPQPTTVTTHWDGYAAGSGNITVTNSLLTLTSLYNGSQSNMRGKDASFTGLGSRTLWAAEARFKVEPGSLQFDTANRDYSLLVGVQSSVSTVSSGMDFRLKPDGSGFTGATCSLAWWGYDPTDYNRVAEVLATLNKGAFYILSAIRKSDGDVDIFLNGSLIAAKPVLNPGVNPAHFFVGQPITAGSGTVTFDYVKLGLPPPIGSIVVIK